MHYALFASALFATVGCTTATTAPNAVEPESPVDSDADLRRRLLGIAADYKRYELVDGRMRVAPMLCAPASGIGGSRAVPSFPEYHLSNSADSNTHGKKLYLMYAAKLDAETRSYIAGKTLDAPGQVIVKESWVAETATEKDPHYQSIEGPHGQRLKTGAQGPLFVMFQIDAKDPRSDVGWVYGTTAPDGKTITGIGRLANCMGCHEKAPHGRLFGLPRD